MLPLRSHWQHKISIHALREERDRQTSGGVSITCSHFNPRAPRGARLFENRLRRWMM